MMYEKELKKLGDYQMFISDINYNFIGFEFNDVYIINPFMDENGINEVNPIKYYGKNNFEKWVNEALKEINK